MQDVEVLCSYSVVISGMVLNVFSIFMLSLAKPDQYYQVLPSFL